MVRADGYFEYESDLFYVEQDQSVDLGKIPLEPCGRLIVRVADPQGRPVPGHFIEFPELDWDSLIYEHSLERIIFSNLPLGPVEVAVKAGGFQSQYLTVDLPAHQTEEISVELTPE
jgi:hypothetical protein